MPVAVLSIRHRTSNRNHRCARPTTRGRPTAGTTGRHQMRARRQHVQCALAMAAAIPPGADTFAQWVDRWAIGPGMNDRRSQRRYTGNDGTVGRGWLPLLDRLASQLVMAGWDRSIAQIKEKFGTLRFYLDTTPAHRDATWDAFVREAESASARTCERCGAPGTLRGGNWYMTRCDGCVGTRTWE